MGQIRGAPSCEILVAHSDNKIISRLFRLISWLISTYENHPKPPKLSIYDQIEVDKKLIWSDKFILCGMVKFGKQYFSSLFFHFPLKYIISDYDKLISPIFLWKYWVTLGNLNLLHQMNFRPKEFIRPDHFLSDPKWQFLDKIGSFWAFHRWTWVINLGLSGLSPKNLLSTNNYGRPYFCRLAQLSLFI